MTIAGRMQYDASTGRLVPLGSQPFSPGDKVVEVVEEPALTRMVALLQELADDDPIHYTSDCDDAECFHCGGAGTYDWRPGFGGYTIEHKPGCPWVEARALLAERKP